MGQRDRARSDPPLGLVTRDDTTEDPPRREGRPEIPSKGALYISDLACQIRDTVLAGESQQDTQTGW